MMTTEHDTPDRPTSPLEHLVRHFPDLNFTVVAKPESHFVEYTAYDITGYRQGQSGEFDVPMWSNAGDSFVEDIREAAPYLHGTVKWDGCSNWYFDEQDRVMLHGCSRDNTLRFGLVMAACWDWTADLCPAWKA